MRNKAYDALSTAADGHNIAIEVKICDLASLLDTSTLPESTIDEAIETYRKRIIETKESQTRTGVDKP